MKANAWLPLTLSAFAVLAPLDLRAQEAPPAAPAGEAVTLQFRHEPGKARRYKFDMKADFVVSPQGDGGGLQLPVGIKSTALFTEKVTGVEGGIGSLMVTPHSIVMDASLLGMSTVIKMEGGKLTMNGQPMKADNLGPLSGLASGKAISVKRGLTGPVADPTAAGPVGGMNLSSAFLVQLPEHPVKIGESWNTAIKLQGASLPIGDIPGAGPSGPMDLKLTHTLKSIETKNGHTHALIATAGTATAAPAAGETMPPAGMEQKYTGTTRFDITDGVILSGQYAADVKMNAPVPAGLGAGLGDAVPGLPGGAAPAPGGEAAPGLPSTMRLEGTMTFGLSEAPVAAAAPAVKKPAAAKKPVVKKKR